MKHQIIYLNGATSAGKTTLGRALQKALPEPFLLIGIDTVIDMMPPKFNDWFQGTDVPGFSIQPVRDQYGTIKMYKVHSGPYGKKMVQALIAMVIALAQRENNIIIDDVSFGKEEVDVWRAALKDFKVLWVGLTAPVEILEQREQERRDRMTGLAKWQEERVHQGVIYDIMLDTHEHRISENVETVIAAL